MLILRQVRVPVIFRDGIPHIWPMSDRMKLWGDTLKQLEQDEEGLDQIYPDMAKFYFPMEITTGDVFKLDQIYVLQVRSDDEARFEELSGPNGFMTLRSEIYRPEYLRGMPDNEQEYFKRLIEITRNTKVVTIIRPQEIKVRELMLQIIEQLAQGR